MEHLSAIAFAARKSLAERGISLSAGHSQQLAAAALGHNNLASYQASGDDDGLAKASDIALDRERLQARADALGHDPDAFEGALKATLEARFPEAKVYGQEDDWLADTQLRFELAIVDDDRVNSQVAMTNGTFPRTDVELPWWGQLDEFDGEEDLAMDFDGLVSVDQDPDRVSWGEDIDVRGMLTVERFGRRLFGRRRVQIEHASLRWFGESNEGDEARG